jgi:hypothetical protein
MNSLKKQKSKRNIAGNSGQIARFNLTKRVNNLERVLAEKQVLIYSLNKDLKGLQDRYNGLVKFNTELFMSLNALVDNLVDKNIINFEELTSYKSKILKELKGEENKEKVVEKSETTLEKEGES